MAAVAALHPADAFEARLAAQVIAADAHTMRCLRLAPEPGEPPAEARRHRAQAATMMRQMQSGLRMLQCRQAVREKAEARMHPAAMQRAGYWFRDASVPLAASQPVQAEPPHDEPPQAEPQLPYRQASIRPRTYSASSPRPSSTR